MESGAWHSANLKDVFKRLGTREKGLTTDEARERLAKYGHNHLKRAKGRTPLKIFLEQFNSFLIWILLGAVVISFLLDEVADAIVILSILLLNAILGFIQEYNAERSLEALKKLAALHTIVMEGR
jgi:Ca2+-transporting ATPase